MIIAHEIRKNYLPEKIGGFAGVGKERGISFNIDKGEIFGVIGPDGAGKTTLLRILATLLLPDSGQASIDGLDVVDDFKQVRKIIGYMPGQFALYPDLSVEENLRFSATIGGATVEENYSIIKDIYRHIEPFKTRRAGALSGGMKQKLALSCALVHNPAVLILDEPTTGVDPVSRKEFWDILGSLKDDGITTIVSTAYMDEAGRCDRIALIREGQFIAMDTPANIIAQYRQTLMAVRADNMFALLQELRAHKRIASSFAFGDVHHITTTDAEFSAADLAAYLQNKGFEAVQVSPISPTIEDCFMELDAEKGNNHQTHKTV